MKLIIQFIDHTNGYRSPPFPGTMETIREMLDKRDEDNPKPTAEDYILVVAVVDEENTQIPQSPLLRVSTFLENYNSKEAS